MKKKSKLIFIITILLISLDFSSLRAAEKAISLIRDDETEEFLKSVTKPIYASLGLNTSAVEVVIINDQSINAFVAGGHRIFINSGLILQSDSVEGLIGVLAHEAGHVNSAHTIQKRNSLAGANLSTIAGYVLGLGSIIAGAPPEAGVAITSASQNIALRNTLNYSRDYENAADTIALNVLKEIGINPEGLKSILKKLLLKQRLSTDIQDEYLLTHPVSEDRINYIENFIKENPSTKTKTPEILIKKFSRIKAKFHGFMDEPRKTRQRYQGQNSFAAKYGLAAAYHQEARFEKSMNYIDQLLKQYPEDVYLNELKAQFLFESGKIKNSVTQYEKVLEMKDSDIIRIKYADALMALQKEEFVEKAIESYGAIKTRDPNNASAINKLGKAYGKISKLDLSYLYLAEGSILMRKYKDAKHYLAELEKIMPETSSNYYRLAELKKELEIKVEANN